MTAQTEPPCSNHYCTCLQGVKQFSEQVNPHFWTAIPLDVSNYERERGQHLIETILTLPPPPISLHIKTRLTGRGVRILSTKYSHEVHRRPLPMAIFTVKPGFSKHAMKVLQGTSATITHNTESQRRWNLSPASENLLNLCSQTLPSRRM